MSLEIDPHKHSRLIFNKEAKATQGIKIVFSTSDAEHHKQENESKQILCPLKKNSKWIMNLNVKNKTKKILI